MVAVAYRYVACKDMAAKAAAAVRDGQMKIVPEAFNATVCALRSTVLRPSV